MRRIRLGLFAATCLIACRMASAQHWPPAPPPFADPYLTQAPIPGQAVYESTSPHAQWHQQTGYGPSSEIPPYLLPADRGFLYDHDSRFDLMVREWVRGTWFSIEYLNWEIEHPGRRLMGAPTTFSRTPTRPFTVPTNDPLGLFTRQAIVGDSGVVDWSDLNGIKGSFGVPITQDFWIEASFWGLEGSTHSFQVARLPGTQQLGQIEPVSLVVTPLLTNGVPGQTLIAYDESFNASYKTEVWSADASLTFNLREDPQGWAVQSILGFKHLQYSEQFGFGGSFTNVSGYDQLNPFVVPPVSNLVRSEVDNYIYGMQIGLRTEFRHKYFTLGAEPKLLFSGNVQKGSVTTNNLREPGNISGIPINDPLTFAAYQHTVFTPGFDFSTYAKIHLTEWINLKVGYGLVWLDRLGTADKNIVYNDNGPLNPPAVTVRRTNASRFMDGLMIGAEILLP